MHASIRLLPLPRMVDNYLLVPVSMVCLTLTAYLRVCGSSDPASRIQHKRSLADFPIKGTDAHKVCRHKPWCIKPTRGIAVLLVPATACLFFKVFQYVLSISYVSNVLLY